MRGRARCTQPPHLNHAVRVLQAVWILPSIEFGRPIIITATDRETSVYSHGVYVSLVPPEHGLPSLCYGPHVHIAAMYVEAMRFAGFRHIATTAADEHIATQRECAYLDVTAVNGQPTCAASAAERPKLYASAYGRCDHIVADRDLLRQTRFFEVDAFFAS